MVGRFLSVAGTSLASMAIWLAPAADAATIHPNRTDDPVFVTQSGCGRDAPDTEHCTLREAIAAAQPGDTVSLDAPAPAGPYVLSGAELSIEKSLTITGPGGESAAISAGEPFRVLTIAGPGNLVVLRGITIRDGTVLERGAIADGGGIRVLDATLRLERATVAHNLAEAAGEAGKSGGIAEGGGIMNRRGTVELIDSTVSANTASANGSAGGGSGGIAIGGAVASREGTLRVTRSRLIGNTATAQGGTGASGGIAEGGGLQSYGTFAVTGSIFTGNSALASGGQAPSGPQSGGIATGGGMAVILEEGSASEVTEVTFSGNLAEATAGPGSSGGTARGGGLLVDTGSAAPVAVSNVTAAANTARALGTGGTGEGGGVAATAVGAPISISGATINANIVEGPASGGGDLEADKGTSIANTIASDGSGPGGLENCKGEGSSLGHNIDSRDQCHFHGPGDLINTSSLLGVLQDNGGPVTTEALLAGSPAVNSGSSSGCPGTDARGVARPQGASCDIGAFELAPPSATTASPSGVTATTATARGAAANPDVVAGTVYFQWGATTAYGSQTPAEPLAAGATGQTVAGVLANLSRGTVYHYRAVASSSDGTSFGADQTFTTSADAPSLDALKISPAKLHAQSGRGASITRKRAPGGGATVSYTDTHTATTTFTVFAQRRGYMLGRRCTAKRSRRLAGGSKRCRLYVQSGRVFTHHDRAGSNSFHFTGRISGRPLPTGAYQLRATAKDASGRVSLARSAAFRII